MVIAAPEPNSQVPKDRLYAFLEQAKEDEIEAVQALRAWWPPQAG